jgi:asparagine synthase (glutamine-hydrolysing)
MCGIFGWLGPQIDSSLALRSRDVLRHRGPDDAGEWFDQTAGVWLGHRRLAILDLSPHGHQPMLSPCGRYVLTYNGEIYNYKELRSRLELAGHAFHGESDTEVVLMACATWGVEFATRCFEGMFAFGLYDRAERVLWLARDPMGIKPLYYAHRGDHFAFSSELTSLLPLSWIDRSIDRDALFSYFRYSCVPAPATILRGVRKLASGTLLRFAQGEATSSSYWNLSKLAATLRQDVNKHMSLQEAADELEARLRHSVRQHMQSDVPYGAFLSGGIDSSTVVALMQAESSRPVKTFSIGFSEASHDESAHARAVAQHLGTDHHELILNSDEIPALVPLIAGYFDEPFADNSSIPTYLVSRFARESVTVCLSGDGGDELFGGYPRYFWAKRIEALRQRLSPGGAWLVASTLQAVPAALWDRVVNPALGYRYSSAEGLAYRVRRFAAYLGCGRDAAYARTMSAWRNPEQLLGFQSKHPLGADALRYPELSWAEEMMLIDQGNYLQDDILTKVDRASMAVSLEVRVPLLTHPLLEFCWQLPAETKLADKGDRGKLVLREVLYRYVPKSLIQRPKQGFGMPVGKWLRGPLREWAESLLTPDGLESCGLQPREVLKIWDEHQRGQDRQAMLWTVLMYRQWHQKNTRIQV